MNKLIGLAALGMAATFALHTFGGEMTVHRPLLTDAATAEMDLYVSVLWHGITAIIALGIGTEGGFVHHRHSVNRISSFV